MTGTQHAWIWATLQEMANLAAEQEAAEAEVARLTEAYRSARARVTEAVPALSIEATVQALRLIGEPISSTSPPAPPAPAPAPSDPLSIPEYLRRGEGSIQEDHAPGATQAHEVA